MPDVAIKKGFNDMAVNRFGQGILRYSDAAQKRSQTNGFDCLTKQNGQKRQQRSERADPDEQSALWQWFAWRSLIPCQRTPNGFDHAVQH